MSEEALFGSMIFVVVLLMSQAFVTPLMGSRRAARKRLRERIGGLGDSAQGGVHASLVKEKYLQRLSPMERRLESLPNMDRLAAFISQAGMETPAHRVVGLSILLCLVAGAIAYAYEESIVFALIAASIAALMRILYDNLSYV